MSDRQLKPPKPLGLMTPADRGAWLASHEPIDQPLIERLYWDTLDPSAALVRRAWHEHEVRLRVDRSIERRSRRDRPPDPPPPWHGLRSRLPSMVSKKHEMVSWWLLHLLDGYEGVIDAARPSEDAATILDRVEHLDAIQRRLDSEMHGFGFYNDDNLPAIREASTEIARALGGVPSEPPEGWIPEEWKTSTPEDPKPLLGARAARPWQWRPRLGRPPKQVSPHLPIDKRRAKLSERVEKIASVLRSAGDTGLSRNAILKRVRGGDAQLTQALQQMLRDGTIEHRNETRNDSRYLWVPRK